MVVTRSDGTILYSGNPIGSLADTGLTADTTYGYVVTTTNSNGTSTGTAGATTPDVPVPPPAPSDPTVTATPNGFSEIDLAITSDPVATSMQIYRDGTQIYTGSPISSWSDRTCRLLIA
jgi:hypothetical protein